MKKISINERIGALILSGFVLAGSLAGCSKASAKAPNLKEGELKSNSFTYLLEDEEIQNITTIDEELTSGNLDIDILDEEFRKKVIDLNYYASAQDEESYNKTLNWLRDNVKPYTIAILFAATKGGIADEEDISIDNIKVYPGPDRGEDTLLAPKGQVEITDGYKSKGYIVKSKQLNKAIDYIASIQESDFSEADITSIVKTYDKANEIAKMTIASGAIRQDDVIKEKNSKKYIKKNFNVK